MVGHLASSANTPPCEWGGKGALMGCTRRMTGPTGTLPSPTADQTHTHTLNMAYLPLTSDGHVGIQSNGHPILNKIGVLVKINALATSHISHFFKKTQVQF